MSEHLEDPTLVEIGTFVCRGVSMKVEVEDFGGEDGIEIHVLFDESISSEEYFLQPWFLVELNDWLEGKTDRPLVNLDWRESGAQADGYLALCEGGA
jgi:hypothetical protein